MTDADDVAGASVAVARALTARYAGWTLPVSAAGHPLPCAILPAPGLVVRTATGRLPIDPALAEAGATHVDAVQRASPRLHDGEVLALVALESQLLTVATGTYLAMIATADALAAEALGGEPEGRARRRAESLASGDPLRRGDGRCAALGVSVAVIVIDGDHRDGTPHVLLGRRSADLPVDAGRLHVVAGMAEASPNGGDPARWTAANEVLEEAPWVAAALGGREAVLERLVPLGLGFDLLRLRPEACFALAVELSPGAVGSLAADEFSETLLVEASREGVAALVAAHGPGSMTAAVAACLALLLGTGAL